MIPFPGKSQRLDCETGDLKNTGGFVKKTALTLETSVLGDEPQPPFPPLQQDCTARKSAHPAPPAGLDDLKGLTQPERLCDLPIPWGRHTEGHLARKSSRDPDFAVRVRNAPEEQLGFGRNIKRSRGSSTRAARARQEAGCQAALAGEILTPSKVNGITGASGDCSHE